MIASVRASEPERRAPAVETIGLGKRFGRTWALRDVSLSIGSGQVVGLVGPNGSGKSTLLRILASATRPTRGDARVFGTALSRGETLGEVVGFLSQQVGLYGELTALENLHFAAAMYGLATSESELLEALAEVGLTDVAHQRVRVFSGGMSKRLALARATLHRPRLILFDEPYSALDQTGARWLDSFFGAARAAGRTALIATHELARTARLCDRIIALEAGRVRFDGPPSAFLESIAGAEPAFSQ